MKWIRKPRSWWTDHRPKFSGLSTPVGRAFVHYAVSRPKDLRPRTIKAWMRGIEAFHRRRGYAAIAYHTLVFRNGWRVVGRPANAQGGATMNWNSRSLAVCAALDGDDSANEKVETAIVKELRRWIRRGKMRRRAEIDPHSAVRQTSCPGGSLRGKIPAIRRRVRG